MAKDGKLPAGLTNCHIRLSTRLLADIGVWADGVGLSRVEATRLCMALGLQALHQLERTLATEDADLTTPIGAAVLRARLASGLQRMAAAA